MPQIHSRRRIAIYTSIMSILIACLYSLIRSGLEFEWYPSLTVLGLALCFINFPIALIGSKRAKLRTIFVQDEYVLTFALLMIACLLGFLSVKTAYFFTAIGLISLFVNLFGYFKEWERYEGVSIVFISLLSIWVIIKVWGGHYLHPMLLELMPFESKGHIDTWFHVAITQMIKTYHIPSTGLNGVPFVPYHFGSHLIFASLSKGLDIHAFTFYQLGFPVVFIPLLFKVVMAFPVAWAERNGQVYNFRLAFWLIFIACMVGVFPNGIMQKATSNWSAFATSESYCVSLIFFFLALHLIIFHFESIRESRQGPKSLLYIICILQIFLIGITKISTLFIFDAVLFYLFLRLKLYKQKSTLIFGTIVAIISCGSLVLTMNESSGHTVTLFHFLNNYVSINIFGFILVYYFWSILLVFLILYLMGGSKRENDYRILIETILVICVAGFLPGAFLHINGGSANYFMDVHFWFSLVFILAILPEVLMRVNALVGTINKAALVVCGAVVILSGIVMIRNFRFAQKRFFRETYVIYSRIGGRELSEELLPRSVGYTTLLRERKLLWSKMDSSLSVSPYYHNLKSLYSLDTIPFNVKRQTALVINDVSLLAEKYPCNIYPFMFPALTGMTRKDGYLLEHCVDKDYSFEYYRQKDLQEKRFQDAGITKQLKLEITPAGEVVPVFD